MHLKFEMVYGLSVTTFIGMARFLVGLFVKTGNEELNNIMVHNVIKDRVVYKVCK